MFEWYIASKKIFFDFTTKIKNNKCIEKSVIENSSLNNYIYRLEQGEFKIAIIAPFSAGKSTFINSLIGQDLLSMEITAETSVITRLLFSEKIKLEIKYRNGDLEVIPSNFDIELNLESIKRVLENKTTVKGEDTEENIEEVKVFYPLELCKNNVEIIDTPGLFARYEKHKDITTKILPKVNAVVFMIDPESVGEKNFTQVIKNYVMNAQNSNMEKEGKHIFFVINKIDKFNRQDINKAKRELIEVLQTIIKEPQIYEISAYYAMIGRMYLSKSINLDKVRKDKKIVIPDPDDPEYTLSGRNIQNEHIPIILNESKIGVLEGALEKYLEEKNRYLLSNLSNEINFVINQSKIQKEKEIENILQLAQEDKFKFNSEITKLEEEIDTIQNKYQRDIEKILVEKIEGGISGNSIIDNMREVIANDIFYMEKELIRSVETEWRRNKIGINEKNAEACFNNIVLELDKNLQVYSKYIIKSSFENFGNQIKKLIKFSQKKINEMKSNIEKVEFETIGKELNNMDGYNLDGVEAIIQRTIQTGFSYTIITLSQLLDNSIKEAIDENTFIEKKPGFIAFIKEVFLNKSREVEIVDNEGFANSMREIIVNIEENISSSLLDLKNSILVILEKPIQSVAEKVTDEVNKKISDLINNKKVLINNIKGNINKSELECEEHLKELNKDLDDIAMLINDYIEIKKNIYIEE